MKNSKKYLTSLKMKKYRFFYHYYKQYDRMSVHFKNTCSDVEKVVCSVPCESKKNKTQPRRVMQGFAKEVKIIDDIAYIN